jgi:glutathione S-transferase
MISLYQAAMSTCVQKVRFVLEQKALPWQGIAVNLNAGENLSPEFMKINPKGLVPVLVDDGDVVFESNNICLYLDEKYPQTPLMPTTPKGRSDVRTLIQLIDEQVHADCSALTYAVAFGGHIRKTYDTPEKLEAYLGLMPDAGRRHSKREIITKGVNCNEFEIAVQRLAVMLKRLDALLQKSTYLVSTQLSIADIVYSPYVTRLDHLSLSELWQDKPALADWYDRIKKTSGYQKGIAAFFNVEVIERMAAGGKSASPAIKAILAK